MYDDDFCCFTVRLVNGPTKYEGRVEVNYNGVWGTVCDDGWDLNDAQVVCTELNYGRAINVQLSAFYGQGSGEIWLDEVSCVGTELTIGNCFHGGWGSHDCGHWEDAGVKCTVGMYLLGMQQYASTPYCVLLCSILQYIAVLQYFD